jgi:antitoxin (DNA-binding transcriptional repressor) of toxin-antitoxin stability system
MTTMTSERLSKNAGDVRRALRNGTEVTLTFRGKPFGRVVAPERIDQLEAEVDRLRKLLADNGLTDQAEETAAA